MGATNTTTYYNLSQFVGTDKPAWLQDYNGDMLKIDTGINAAKVAADSAALDASAAQLDATTALGDITNTINPAITSLQTTVGNQGGAINTINSLIGNGTPTTTDQTIIGAINEINAEVGTINSSLSDIGDRTILAQSSSTTWANVAVSLDDYREIEVTYTNDSGKVYLAQSISKDLFITRDSANKCFAPEIYTSERNGGEFYYTNGNLYYRKAMGTLNVAIAGIK